MTFDIDEKGPEVLDAIYDCFEGEQPPEAVTILETRGGYHVLIRPSLITDSSRGQWHRNLSKMADVKGDSLLPVPGTYQGGFTPKFIEATWTP